MNDSDTTGCAMSSQRRESAKGGEPGIFGYCLVTGALASAFGAGASLLGGSAWVRLAIWLAVLVAAAAAAGWWWTKSPARARHWVVGLWARPVGRDAPSRKA